MVLTTLAGLLLIAVVLWDAFETIVLPRRVGRQVALTRYFYRLTWRLWSAATRFVREAQRDVYLSFFGPLSLLLLLEVWAIGLLLGFALLFWSVGAAAAGGEAFGDFGTALYLSGTTFFTLGLGDVTPHTPLARVVAVGEVGTGFAFLALVIGYLPVIYQSFTQREVTVSLLDQRAGSPPSALELLRRHRGPDVAAAVEPLLHNWELWAAELLESHLAYPPLAYFRSQHDNQSWLAALTAVMDACALVIVGQGGSLGRQARFTFAMTRHAAVDLSQVFNTPPRPPRHDRLPEDDLTALRRELVAIDLPLLETPGAEQRLADLRSLYEPHVSALAEYLHIALPPWLSSVSGNDNWQRTAWLYDVEGDEVLELS